MIMRVTPSIRSKNSDKFYRRPSVRRRFFFSCFRSDDTEAFSCLKSDDFQQEGVFPNSLCHISDEMPDSPACSSLREQLSSRRGATRGKHPLESLRGLQTSKRRRFTK
jgi:hypothetical protein